MEAARLKDMSHLVASSRSADMIERFFQVRDDIMPIFKADRQPNAARLYASGLFFLFGPGAYFAAFGGFLYWAKTGHEEEESDFSDSDSPLQID